jgi:uncharacterized protein
MDQTYPPSAPTAPTQPPLWLDQGPARPRPPGPNDFALAQDPKFPGIGISAVWIVVYFGLQILLSIPAMLVSAALDPTLREQLGSGNLAQTREALLDASAVPVLVALVLAGVLTTGLMWLQLRKQDRHETIGLFARSALPTGKTIGYGVGLMVGALVASALYSNFVLRGRESQADTQAIIDALDTPFAYLLGFVAIVVVAPVIEELLFRGYLQTAFRRRMHPNVAVLLSAAIFAAVHMQPLAFPVLALLGAVFGYLYQLTGSLKVNIALHMANNGLAFLALVAAGSGAA